MDFLKELLGEDLFNQLVSKINEHNGNEANKDNQIKLGNLGKGDYVAKGKYEALDAQLQGKITELTSANDLIEQMKKATKGNEELQGKITTYETQVSDLQAQLAETKLKSAVKVALLSEKAVDVDYLTYVLENKLKEKGETLELDENDNIKGWETHLSGLKTQCPTMFESGEGGNGFKPLGGDPLPPTGGNNEIKKEDLLKMPYAERNKLYSENPEAFAAALAK